MAINREELENELKKKKLNNPRLTPYDIQEAIVKEHYFIVPDTQTTICALTLKNGFTVIGHSAPASPKNFDKDIGEKVSRAHAVEKIWELEGYLLKQKLYEKEKANVQ
jgi:hypothetical protein